MITIKVQYFAILREQRGESAESLATSAGTALELYTELKDRYRFTLSPDVVRVAINHEFKDWKTALKPGDHIVFIPPVAGG